MSDKLKDYSVYYLADSGIGPKDIAKELGLTLKETKDILNKRPQSASNENIKTTTAKVTNKDLMIRETSGKGTKSVAIMTKAASENHDEFRKKMNSSTSNKTNNAIYRPNDRKKWNIFLNILMENQ